MGYSADGSLRDLFPEEPVRRAARRIAEGGRDLLRIRAAQRTPVSKPTPGHSPEQHLRDRNYRPPGKMRESWKDEPVIESKAPGGTPRFGADVFNTDPNAIHVEYPTRPHMIRPRADRAPATVLSTKKPRGTVADGRARLRVPMPGGGYAFPEEVMHPGTQGVYMMRNALTDVRGSWEREVGAPVLRRMTKEMRS